jgi:hypothetical protein
VFEDFEIGEELGEFAGFEEMVGAAGPVTELDLGGAESLVDEHTARGEDPADLLSERAVEIAKDQHGCARLRAQRNHRR